MIIFFVLSIVIISMMSFFGKYIGTKAIIRIDQSNKSEDDKKFYFRVVIFCILAYGIIILFVGPLVIKLGEYVLK